MTIYLVRHGVAADEGYAVDAHRPLTDAGRERMRRTAAAWAGRAGARPARWITSPLVRAVQTCEICLAAFGDDGPAEVRASLEPEAPVSRAAALAEGTGKDVALVGHEPLMSALASHLAGIAFGGFKKGMVVAIDRKPGGRARISWRLVPAKDDREPAFVDG